MSIVILLIETVEKKQKKVTMELNPLASPGMRITTTATTSGQTTRAGTEDFSAQV